MKLRYGNYTHEDNECVVTINRDATIGQDGKPVFITERWDVVGTYFGSSVAVITSGLKAIEKAYEKQGKDISILTPTGGATAHKMRSSETTQGTRVVRPVSYPNGAGAEYAILRTYSLSVEGVFVAEGREPLLTWREGISQVGSGRGRWTYQFPIWGEPQKQGLSQYSPVTIVQSGQATALNVHPTPPAPLWPENEVPERHSIDLVTPQMGAVEFLTTWSYTFYFYEQQSFTPSRR